MGYPEIPPEISRELASLRIAAASAFQREDWETAVRRLDETYDFLVHQQQQHKRRFHKGWELHNWGWALIHLGHLEDGITRVFLAYTEDALSAETGQEDAIDGGPAGRTLKEFGVDSRVLEAIKAAARQRKQEARVPFTPDELSGPAITALAQQGIATLRQIVIEPATQSRLSTAEPQLAFLQLVPESVTEKAKEEEKARQKRTIEGLEHPHERRCFIGGNYHAGRNLELIRQLVCKEGFDAVVAKDFEIKSHDVHHRSLLLLHLCSKAIFEVSDPAGQLMELERCRDFDVKPLVLRQVMEGDDPQVSAMISSMTGMEVQPYTLPEDLSELIKKYLSE